MRMRQTSVGATLRVAFALLITLLAGIGWLGLNRMGQINDDLTHVFDDHWAKVQFAREIELRAYRNTDVLPESGARRSSTAGAEKRKQCADQHACTAHRGDY